MFSKFKKRRSGYWLPTATNVLNTSSITPSLFQYTCEDGVVTFSGAITYDPIGVSDVEFRLSIPIPSNFSLAQDAVGVGATDFGSFGAAKIEADVTNKEMLFKGQAPSGSVITTYITGRYIIRPS